MGKCLNGFDVSSFLDAGELLDKISVIKSTRLLEGASRYSSLVSYLEP